jgi:Tol biopolymer transport system component
MCSMVRSFVACCFALAVPLVAAATGSGRSGLVAADEQVYVVPAAGGAVRQLTSEDLPSYSPSWSPDGKRLAYVQGTHISVLDRSRDRTKRIAFVRLLGPDPPAWSPDGRRIAFTALSSPEGRASVSVVASTGSSVKVLASTPWGTGDAQRGPVWSADGKLLAFCLQGPSAIARGGIRISGHLDLAVVSLNGSQRRLTVPAGDEYAPSWSPDGRSVLYASRSVDGRSTALRIVPRNADLSRLVVRLSSIWGAAWSPDGKLIAFTGSLRGESRAHLYVVRPDGSGLRRLTGEVTPDAPVWSPNGRLVAFGTYKPGIDVVAPDGSGRRTVASVPDMDIGHLAWSPDGTTIAFDARKQRPES